MSNYVKLATEAADSYFATLTETQDSILKATTAFAAWVPAPPSPAALGFAELPTMQEITEASFSFSQKFLKTQEDFVEKLIAASTSTANASARSSHAKAKSAA